MSRREQIRMLAAEVALFLDEQRVINVATMGPQGRPHLAPLWYARRGEQLVTWTYGSSQKVANLRRLGEATVLVESGDSYEQLRGVSMECDVEVREDTERALELGTALMQRYTLGGAEVPPEMAEFLRAQAAKRVGLVFTPTKTVSWDHRKLAGAY